MAIFSSYEPRNLKYYPPFVIPGIILGAGIFILLLYKPDNGLNPYYGKLAIGVALPIAIAEWFLLKLIFPPKQIKLDSWNGKYYLRFFDNKIKKLEFEIESFKYGWSYQFNHPSLRSEDAQSNPDAENNQDRQKAGTNTIDLYVVLISPGDKQLHLFESGCVFDEIPNQWPYILPNDFDEEALIDFVNLEGLVKAMGKTDIGRVKP